MVLTVLNVALFFTGKNQIIMAKLQCTGFIVP